MSAATGVPLATFKGRRCNLAYEGVLVAQGGPFKGLPRQRAAARQVHEDGDHFVANFRAIVMGKDATEDRHDVGDAELSGPEPSFGSIPMVPVPRRGWGYPPWRRSRPSVPSATENRSARRRRQMIIRSLEVDEGSVPAWWTSWAPHARDQITW